MINDDFIRDPAHTDSTLEQLLAAVEELAKVLADGHLTIYRFTTGWKVVLDTPQMEMPERLVLQDHVVGGLSLMEALRECLRDPVELSDEDMQQVSVQHFENEIRRHAGLECNPRTNRNADCNPFFN